FWRWHWRGYSLLFHERRRRSPDLSPGRGPGEREQWILHLLGRHPFHETRRRNDAHVGHQHGLAARGGCCGLALSEGSVSGRDPFTEFGSEQDRCGRVEPRQCAAQRLADIMLFV